MRPLKNAPFRLRQRTLADQAQILILKILNVFLWLKLSPFLALNKIEHSSKVSISEDDKQRMVIMQNLFEIKRE
jgi:hypothetical protein